MSDVDLAPPTTAPHPPLSGAVAAQATGATGATRKLIRGSSLLLFGRLISVLLNFAVQVVTVRYLAKSDYGAFAYGMGVVSTGATAVMLGLDKASARFVVLFQERGEPRKVLGTIALAVMTVWGLGLSLVVLLHGFRSIIAEQVVTDPLALSLLLVLIALVPVSAFDSLQQRLLAVFIGARAIFFRRHLLGPGLKLAVVLLVVATGGTVHLMAWGYLVAGIFGIAVYAAVLVRTWRRQGLLRHFPLRAADIPARTVFVYAVPLLSSELVLVLRDSLAVILLGHLQTSTAVAEYQAVMPAAKLNLIVSQSFSFLFLPLAARLSAREDRRGMNDLYWQTTMWIAVISFPAFAATFILARPAVELFFGAQYATSAPVLAVLAVGHYVHASFGFNAMTLRVHDRTAYILAIDAAALVVGLTLNLVLIPSYGAIGAAVGTTATFVIHNLLANAALQLSGTGVQVIQWRFLGVYGVIALATGLLWLADRAFAPPLPAGVALVIVASLLLIRLTRGIVRPAETFPELQRVPGLRWLIGHPRGPDRAVEE